MASTIHTIKPKALKKNSLIGLIAPAGPITESQLVEAQENLAEMGFRSTFTDRIFEKRGYLAGDDQTRLDDFHEAFANENIEAILCIRGGYGSARLLDVIDYELIKKHPKIFIGYSDITALLNAIWQRTGLITFHGVVGVSAFTSYSRQQFISTLMNSSKNHKIEAADNKHIDIISKGKCQGQLIGGNLSILNSLLSTPFEPHFDNKILFIEEVNEAPYKIDRMLTQLLLSAKIQKVSGIILGQFKGCDIDNEDITSENSLSLRAVFEDRLSQLNVPVISGFSFGHIAEQALFPIGIKASFDTDVVGIELLESMLI